jgi:hypothetical protein
MTCSRDPRPFFGANALCDDAFGCNLIYTFCQVLHVFVVLQIISLILGLKSFCGRLRDLMEDKDASLGNVPSGC